MKIGHLSKLRVLMIALIFGSVMVLGQTQRADANLGEGVAGLLMLYVLFLSTASVVCAPVAAVSSAASDKKFDEAYGNCFLPVFWLGEPIPAEDDEDLPETTLTLEDEQINPNEKSIEIVSVETKAEIKAKAEKETGVDVPNEPAEEEDEGWYRDDE